MLYRINHKIYGIACLFIALSLISVGGLALFLDKQTTAADQEQQALISASDFFTIRQVFLLQRAWENTAVLKSNPGAQNRFTQSMQRLKKQLEKYSNQVPQQQRKSQLNHVITTVVLYEKAFEQLAQFVASHQLLQTDIKTAYQSLESASLNHGSGQLLRKVFLLNHFQVVYFEDQRTTGFQALSIVLNSMSQAFADAGLLDERRAGYIASYKKLLVRYNLLAAEIQETTDELKKHYLTTVNSLETISSDLQQETNDAIQSSNKRRQHLKNAMLIYFPLGTTIIFLFLVLLAKKIVTPINTLLKIIDTVKAGETKKRFQPVGNPRDELNQLGNSFNDMLDTLNDNQSKVLEYQSELTDKVAELAETNEKLQTEITERMIAYREKVNLEEQLQQSQKMEAIGTLAGGIAHDFNNVISAIIGYAELVEHQLTDGTKEKKRMGEILKAADRAKRLVQQILIFSRKSGEKREKISIDSVVTEAIALIRQTIPTSIQMNASIDTHTGTIAANETQIHQVVMNLCTNAYHAVRDAGGNIDVGLKPVQIDPVLALKYPQLQSDSYAQITVTDTGIGMSPATLARIFDPFFTTKKQGEGTGMGLSVAYGIIKSHDGIIDVESTAGKGTTFRVFLPLLLDNHITAIETKETPLTGNERILFVDDEPMLVDLTKSILEVLGYQVTATTSANEALALFRNEPDNYNLVITDQTMPEMTGADLVKEIMAIRPETPIIICTGYSETIDEERAKTIGAKALLMKPVDQKTLATSIRKHLDNNG